MRNDLRARWQQEVENLKGKLKCPRDLLMREMSPEDFLDTAVVGGVSVGEIVAGKISELQIPENVKEAFHLQYPNVPYTFVEEVGRLSRSSEQIQGLINGVKGKLFEIDYAKWLNEGHLPTGYTAALAQNANNPAWDIVVRDSHGHIDELLQMKATASLPYVQAAIAAHPNIDVVVPHDLYDQLSHHPELFEHVIDSHQHLTSMASQVSEGIGHAEAAGIHFHFPVIGMLFAASQNFARYRRGNIGLQDALQNFGERAILFIISSGVNFGVSLAATPFVGVPFAMSTRMVVGQFFHNRNRRKVLDMRIQIVRSSRRCLELQATRT